MIRAVVKNGVVAPLDPLPSEWSEGQELAIEAVEREDSSSEREGALWLKDMDTLTADLTDVDWLLFDATLATADESAKALVRRDMGLGE